MSDDDVDGLTLQSLPKSRVKLTWKAEPSVPGLYGVTNSVFRSDDEGFEPNDENRVLAGIKTKSVGVSDPSGKAYSNVRSVHTPRLCALKPEPGFHGAITLHPLADDSGGLRMSLRTKWRPDTLQKDTLSYIVRGFYFGTGYESAYYVKARRCSYSLDLLDSQGFKITEIELGVLAIAGNSGKTVGLEANDLSNLTSEKYKAFAQGGDWNLSWTCPKY